MFYRIVLFDQPINVSASENFKTITISYISAYHALQLALHNCSVKVAQSVAPHTRIIERLQKPFPSPAHPEPDYIILSSTKKNYKFIKINETNYYQD